MGGILGAAMLLGYTSCTDDHFDIRTDVPSATNTLWQNIEANEQLSDLGAILKRVKVYTKEVDTKRSITYADLLNQSQNFTFWAPLNGTYNAQSYLDQLDQIDQLRSQIDALSAQLGSRADEDGEVPPVSGDEEGGAASDSEIAKQIAELQKKANLLEYNVGVQFAQNHIARFNYEALPGTQEVRLLNGKLCTYDAAAGQFNGVALHADMKTIPAANGTMHVIEGVAPFSYNVYEYFGAHSDIFDNVYSTLIAYDKNTFWAEGSVSGAMNEQGEMVYVDSAYINQNELLNQSFAQIKNEDSLYVTVAPTDAAWEDALEKVRPLFKYATSYKYDYKNSKFDFASQLKDLDADSLSEYNLRKALLTSMYFSPSIFGQKFERDDIAGIVNYAEHADSLISTNGTIYYNPNAETKGKNPLFGNVNYVKASNGIIYPLESYDLDPSYSFMRSQTIDLRNSYNIGSVVNGRNGNYGETFVLTEGQNLNPNVDVSIIEDGTYRYFQNNGSQVLQVYIPLRNLYSGKYRIRVQLLPNNANVDKAWIDKPATDEEPETYEAQNTKLTATLYSDDGEVIANLGKADAVTIEEDAAKFYTLWESVEFPKCYVNLPSGINNSFPLLMLSVAPANQEAKKAQHALSIAKIVVEPVHPEDVQ